MHLPRLISCRSLVLALACWSLAVQPAIPAEPTFAWREAKPEEQGFDSAKLAALGDALMKRGTKAFLVIRNDAVLFERYAEGFSRTKPHYSASMAKAVVGGTSLALAMDDGRIKANDLGSKFVPSWAGDPLKSKITIAHLATHTSGIEDAHADGVAHADLPGWMGEFWKRLPPPRDPFTLSRDVSPVREEPGAKARYSNPGMAMLAWCVTASLRGSVQPDIRSLLKARVFHPLGVPDAEWSVGYGKTVTVDGLPLVANWGGGGFSPNATARVARMMLRGGDWEGRKILAHETVKTMLAHAGLPNNSGLAWWVNRELNGNKRWPSAPVDAFWGAGAGHQFLFVVPSLNLIVVRNGGDLDKGDYNGALEKHLVMPLLATLAPAKSKRVQSAPPTAVMTPCPYSPVIKSLTWAPKESIVRKAKGGDNWPMTWADDDLLYTAYGDGRGFEPFVPEKLSIGFAKVSGGPRDFTGLNFRAPSAEAKGDDKRGHKASGLLMVDGALYLLARNKANAQLAWSTDHGVTWTWADWKFTTSFGCPTFLNFGKNYAGARDGFVFLYSHDSNSAYTPVDRFVLARVPKGKLRERAAYEFFVKRDGQGQPAWSKDIAQRGAVFTHPGNCYRSGVTYNAALKRYLWCQILPASPHPQGPRFAGGFGIYDAPEPWGPWTTVFFTENWDVGPGETSSFPTKWMSADGKELWLVFSGDDHFSVRQATLAIR